ncbi:hypothetical protein LTR53_017702, partial [Teratosphaeriaceae sp. CCFEE 6253]
RDDAEKTAQVALMFWIYRNAWRTIAWMGSWSAHPRQSDMELGVTPLPLTLLLEEDGGMFAPTGGLSSLPYCRRRWVVREVAAPAGDDAVLAVVNGITVRWEDLTARKVRAEGIQDVWANVLEPGGAESWGAVSRARTTAVSTASDLAILEMYSATECSDPRDRVVALQGMNHSEWSLEQPFLVDYGLSVVQVYTGFARDMVARRYGLCLILIAAQQARGYHKSLPGEEGLPSWAPDWRLSGRLARSVTDCDKYYGTSLRIVDGCALEVRCRLTHRLEEDWHPKKYYGGWVIDIPKGRPQKGDVRGEIVNQSGYRKSGEVIEVVLRPQEMANTYQLVHTWMLGSQDGYYEWPKPKVTKLSWRESREQAILLV